MKVFSHGSNVNFQISTREMLSSELERLVHNKINQNQQLVLGVLYPNKEQLEVFGHLIKCSFMDQFHSFEIEEEEDTIQPNADQFIISQEAIFTIEDERKGQVEVEVLYFTYEQNDEEMVYFCIDELAATHPMACVVQFYEQVKNVGRDVDFSLTGCSVNEWKPN